MRPLAASVELVLLSAWLGAALVVSAAVAPAAFAVLPSRTLAGALIGQVLPVVFITGILVAVVAVGLEMQMAAGSFRLRVMAPLVALALGCIVAQFVIGPKIARIRDAVSGPMDALDAADPRRMQFGSLHGFSVMWLGVAMLGAAIAVGLNVHADTQRNPINVHSH